MNKPKRLLILFTGILLLIVLVACGGTTIPIDEDNMAVIKYPDFPLTGQDKNSWEYLDGSTNLTVNWYVDVASWNPPTGLDVISGIIKQKTGITVVFDTPVTDDGQKLATMIAGGDLPDVISIPTNRSQTITSLAQQGYVYDINTLAEKWAPTLLTHLPQDVLDWWSYGNGKTYGIPNHYYSYEDVPTGQLQPNGGMMVRKDIFDAWQNHVSTNLKDSNGNVTYTSISGIEKQVPWQGFITTPEGFKQAALWALQNYGSSLTTGLQLSQFRADGSASLNWLSQFFAIPFEDASGNYVYQFTQEAYKDMLFYLNDLYLAGVISPANFTQDYDGVGSVIASGKAFATLVTPQDYQIHFTTARDGGYNYESMYITNSNGDAPVLSDIRGYGYMFNMITTDAKRPDILIKLFDFLTSKEGQRLIAMGPEGTTWNWTNGLDSEIVYTETYLQEKANSQTAKYGLLQFDLLLNWQYYDNVQPKTNHGKTAAELFRTNMKRPLTVYAYDYNAMAFVVDATDKRFQTYNNNLTRIETTIGTQLPKIIRANSRQQAESIYNSTVSAIEARGLSLIIEMNSEAYLKAKQKLGITIAWPPNQVGYINPLNRLQPNGDTSKYRGY